MTCPTSTQDLLRSERQFLTALQRLGFCRIELLRIQRGELVLNPWPKVVRKVKFGGVTAAPSEPLAEFELKRQLVEFFEYVRSVEDGEIQTLDVHNGLPFSMEIEQRPGPSKDSRHA